MILRYLDLEYECVSAERVVNSIIIHTGRIEDNEEIIYQIVGDINFEAVVLEDGVWTETAPVPEFEVDVWDELDAAYQEGVDSI